MLYLFFYLFSFANKNSIAYLKDFLFFFITTSLLKLASIVLNKLKQFLLATSFFTKKLKLVSNSFFLFNAF